MDHRIKKKSKILSDVALGIMPPDTVITNAAVFNVFTREFIKGQSVWIKDGMIAYVGSENDFSRTRRPVSLMRKEWFLSPVLLKGIRT